MTQKRNKERWFCTQFSHWIRHNHWGKPFAWEAKVVYDNKPLNFLKDIKEHQWLALSLVKHKHLCYKISDMDMMEKPFDGFFLTNCEAYFIIYWVEKGNREFFIIDYDVMEKERQGSRSLTKDKARLLAELVGTLK